MRVLIGVGQVTAQEPEAARWVRALGMADLQMEWMHVVAAQTGGIWALDPMILADFAERQAEHEARQSEAAQEHLAAASPEPVTVRVRIGHPAVELLGRADDMQPAFIAVQASEKHPVQALWLGSVARALVEGAQQSVLVTRGSAPDHPLRVVVATDHSAYVEAALAKLVALAPRGIGRLTMVYALPESGSYVEQAQQRTQEAALRLGEQLGLAPDTVQCRVGQGDPFPVIEAALADTDADLLILGAKGHSLLERLTLGSVSFRCATSGSRTTLLLRV